MNAAIPPITMARKSTMTLFVRMAVTSSPPPFNGTDEAPS